MLELFKARLKAKSTAAGAQNLTNARLDAMSAKLNAKFPDLTDEAEHDAKIDDFYDAEMFKEFAALDDFQTAQAARKKAKDKADKDAKDKADKNDPPKDDTDDDVKTMLKTLLEQNRTLSEKVAGIEKEKTFTSIKSKISEGLKDVPEKIWSRMALPDKEEEVETFITSVKQDWVDLGLASQSKPGGGSGGAGNGKASKEEVKSIVDKIMPR